MPWWGVLAAVLHQPRAPLRLEERPDPLPGPGQLRARVKACAVCRTDLHVVDGELPNPSLPLIPGHEIVARVEELGPGVTGPAPGTRIGIGWLGWTCGECPPCRGGRENLCPRARFTGYTLDGGFAEQVVADARFCLPLPDAYGDVAASPLLCAGLIGYRTLRKAGPAARLGIYGFGAAAHLVVQMARAEGTEVFAFTRPGDAAAQAFALRMGCRWSGGSDEPAPVELDAALVFAPAGELVPRALRALRPGGTVVCGGIHMSDIPTFPYRDLWMERTLTSVANLTRADGREFLALAGRVALHTETVPYPLSAANEALADLRSGRVTGAAVLVP